MSQQISASAGGIAARQRELWNLIKARRQARQERREALDFVEQQLGSLLLGVELTPSEQAQYVSRLAETIGTARVLQQELQVPDLAEARVPRDLYLVKAGGISWRPFPLTRRQVEVTPHHRRLQARLAMAIKQRRKLAPESLTAQVHSVGFRYGDRRQEDRVELSGWGVRALAMDNESATLLPAPRQVTLTSVSVDR